MNNTLLLQTLVGIYIKAGCIGWIAMVNGLVIRLLYVVMKGTHDIREGKDVLDNVNIPNKNRKRNWVATITMIVIWPWGLLRVAKNYRIVEQRTIKELQKRELN